MIFRPLPMMTLFTLAALVVLVLFGNWQWSRYTGKMAARGAEPEWANLSGVLLPETGRYVYAYFDGQSAWRGVFAVETADSLVYVPQTLIIEVNPPEAPPGLAFPDPFQIALRGVWRDPQPRGAFTPREEAGSGVFYVLDPNRLAETLAPEDAARVLPRLFEPETLLLLKEDGTGPVLNPVLRAGGDDRLPPERHFGYALTWWGLALALVGVYAVYHYQRGRLGLRRKDGA